MDTIAYIVNVEAAIYDNDKWLIIKRSEMEEHAPGLLSMVGGKVETNINEDNILEKTLIREIAEEVGIEVFEPLQYVESKSFTTDKGQAVVDVIFLCRYKSGRPRCVSEDEVSEVHWMTCEEILEEGNSPVWLRESIRKAEKARVKYNGEV